MSLSPDESRRAARVLHHPLLRERKREIYRVLWDLDYRPAARLAAAPRWVLDLIDAAERDLQTRQCRRD
jgi:hypothetical protein